MIVYNYQTAEMIRGLRELRAQAVKTTSKALANAKKGDRAKGRKYLKAVPSYIDWIISQPQYRIDFLEIEPIDLGEPEVIDMPRDGNLDDLLVLFDSLENEVDSSQPGKPGNTKVKHDDVKLRGLSKNMDVFLKNYVAQKLPRD